MSTARDVLLHLSVIPVLLGLAFDSQVLGWAGFATLLGASAITYGLDVWHRRDVTAGGEKS